MTLSAADATVGTVFEGVVVDNLTRTQIVQYAGASGDFNPIHTDEAFVTQVAGFPTVFAHGMLTMAMTGVLITDTVGDGRLVRFGGRFRAQVWPGDTLTARAEVVTTFDEDGDPVVELAVTTTNQDGVEVFVGTAVARLDP